MTHQVMSSQTRIALYIDPPSHHFLGDRLFNPQQTKFTGDDLMAPYAHLRHALESQGIPVRTADFLPATETPDTLNLYVSMGIVENYARLARRNDVILSGLFAMECPINEPTLYQELPRASRDFKRIFSWTDGASLKRFTGERVDTLPFRWPQSFNTVHEDLWQRRDRKFLVMINANKLPRIDFMELYRERLRAVTYFGEHKEIDLFGGGWQRPPNRVGKSLLPHTLRYWYLESLRIWQKFYPDPQLLAARTVYRGRTESKSATLSQYTFALCFENMVMKGWITEKLFDCFFSGTVPIYWGPPEITEVVPKECYIDMREFSGYAELRDYLKSLRPDQVDSYRQNARDFLCSEAFKPFTKEAFTDIFLSIVNEDGQSINSQKI